MRLAISLVLLIMLNAALASDDPPPEAPGGEWLPLAPQSLELAKDSALDLSALVPAAPAGSAGALTLGADGRLHLGGEASPRFNCAMLTNGPNMGWAMPTHEEADALALQLRRHGYTLVRFHFMDGRLAAGAPRGQEVNPENLDRYHYLLAALKRNGIYWMLDILTSPNGSRTGDYSAPQSINDLKVRVIFDPAARAAWLRMMREVYARTNPYTGLSPLADPALAFVVGVNENSLAFRGQLTRDGPYPVGLAERFDGWVRQRFPDVRALAAALPDLTTAERSGKAPVAPPSAWTATGERGALFRRFASALEVDSYHWMSGQLRAQGYKGPLLAYPEWYSSLDNRTRGALPITDLHAYVGEVTRFDPGTALKLPSMVDNRGLGDWLSNPASRWLDRPLLLSEYGSPFPNPYRRESGLFFPAISAFQDYSAICRMATMSIEPQIPADSPKAKGIYPYSVGIDPIARVAETLSTLLFYRRDVAAAPGPGIAVPFGEAEMRKLNSGFIPMPVKRAALLVKFGLIPPDKVDGLPAGTQIVPLSPPPQGLWLKAVDRLISIATGSAEKETEQLVSTLFARHILPPGNRTSVTAGHYQSGNGEMLLDQPGGTFSIITPRTEAITTKAAKQRVALDALSLVSVNEGALVAASSLDGKPLRRSGRILLMLAGDARNRGMALAGNGPERALVSWGTLPILLQRVIAKIELRRDAPFTGHLGILALNGTELESRAVASDADGSLRLTLDTAAIPSAPTTYFVLKATP